MARGTFRITSRLAAPAAEVWAEVSTFEGVNRELGPWLRMTAPPEAAGKSIAEAPIGERMFRSWLLVLGVLPMDYDDIVLERVLPGRGFDERSKMLSMSVWEHRRRIEPLGEGACDVTDELAFEPRLAIVLPIARRIVAALFRHRHARLCARFGAA